MTCTCDFCVCGSNEEKKVNPILENLKGIIQAHVDFLELEIYELQKIKRGDDTRAISNTVDGIFLEQENEELLEAFLEIFIRNADSLPHSVYREFVAALNVYNLAGSDTLQALGEEETS